MLTLGMKGDRQTLSPFFVPEFHFKIRYADEEAKINEDA